jgi:hypothetical protein
VSDLQEIRRFWPWVKAKEQKSSRGFYPRNRRGVYMGLGYSDAIFQFPAGWWIWVQDDRDWRERRRNPWSGANCDTPAGVRYATIAAAMAAAGFVERKPDKYARQRQQKGRWVAEVQRGEGSTWSLTQPEYRQRPRKKVRLGQRKRSAPDVWRDPYALLHDYWYGPPFAGEKVEV